MEVTAALTLLRKPLNHIPAPALAKDSLRPCEDRLTLSVLTGDLQFESRD